ncbi:hypothetical protein ScPMuIL_016860 [Solemya velum]
MTPQLIFLVILFLFIVVGNSCVLTAIHLSESGRKTRMNFFIMHLAIADLCVGLFSVSVDIVEKVTIEWYAGNAVCRITRFIQFLVMCASTYVLVSLSVDRFDAIARPMNFSRRAFRARMLIYSAWITAVLLAVPAAVLFFDFKSETGETYCMVDFPDRWHWQLYLVLITFVEFIIPAIIITVCYTVIISIIWRKSKLDVDNNGRTDNAVSEKFSIRERGSRGVIPLAKIRTIKMTLIIILVFVFCWSPYFIFNLLDVFLLKDTDSETYQSIRTFIQSMAPLNSAANPIIYGAFSTKICRNLRRIRLLNCIAKMCCRCRITRRHAIRRFSSHSRSQNQSGDNTQTTAEGSVSLGRFSGRRISGLQRNSIPDKNIIPKNRKKQLLHYKSQRLSHPNIHNAAVAKNSTGQDCLRTSTLPLARRQMSEQDSKILKTVAVRYSNGKCETML